MTPVLADVVGRVRRTPPRVVVVGDAILDRWLRGRVRRLSREAPVPVVDAAGDEDCPGGAANTAMNLAALGARTRLLSVVGDDEEGGLLLRALDDAGVDTSDVLVREGRTTTSKTRVVGDDQIVVRVDRAAEPLDDRERVVWRALLAGIRPDDAVLVGDYGSDLFDDATIAVLAAGARPSPLVVDAHDVARWRPWRPDVVTPNAAETAALLREEVPEGRDRIAALSARADDVLRAAGSAAAVVTLDRDGTIVLQDGRVSHRTTAVPAPEHQANGAGDTFAAALTLALATGAPLPVAAELAQSAADVVVSRSGTAVCTLADLAADDAPLTPPAELRRVVDAARAAGRRIVFTNGCFDVLHLGHTVHLQQARALGDLLVVALNDDASVARLKGHGRPVNPLADRARMLAALDCVDLITVFSEDSPTALLRELRPDVYAKGGTHTAETLPEAPVVREYGGEIRVLGLLPEHSTIDLAHRLAQSIAVA